MSSRRDCSRGLLGSSKSTTGGRIAHTDTKMSVDRGITSGTRQVLVLSVWDVEVRLGVAVLLGQTKVNDVDLVATLANTHQEIVGLDITVNEGLGVNVLDARDELVGQEKNSLERELSVAKVEKVLQAGTEEVKNHGVVIALGSKPPDKRDANTTGKGLVDASLIFELGVLGLDALELDGDLFSGDDVGTEVDVTERTGSNLSADPVLVADAQILMGVMSVNEWTNRCWTGTTRC